MSPGSKEWGILLVVSISVCVSSTHNLNLPITFDMHVHRVEVEGMTAEVLSWDCSVPQTQLALF